MMWLLVFRCCCCSFCCWAHSAPREAARCVITNVERVPCLRARARALRVCCVVLVRGKTKERVHWLYSKCSAIVGRMRTAEWLRKVDERPQDIEWRTISEKLELEFIVDSYKRELANSILLQ